jgi:hypothetical protein
MRSPLPGVLPEPIRPTTADVQLWWLPLGAGGSPVVRASGRLYEGLVSRREHRPPADLYHSALRIVVEDAAFVIEVAPAWSRPAPDEDGIVATGAVGARPLGTTRWFRYEIRRWRGGVIPDQRYAVGGPRHLSADPAQARVLLSRVDQCPTLVWGRDQLRTGEMWNSNSVVSWLLSRSGLDPGGPPAGGRAPGWGAGLELARRQRARERR